MKIDQHVGHRIAAQRQQRGLAPEQLADALGVTAADVNSIEAGAARCTGEQIVKLSELLEVAPSTFFGG